MGVWWFIDDDLFRWSFIGLMTFIEAPVTTHEGLFITVGDPGGGPVST